MSINFPPTSSALSSVRGELGCVRFYYLIETDGGAQLVVRKKNIETDSVCVESIRKRFAAR